jgi:hypothetical protein
MYSSAERAAKEVQRWAKEVQRWAKEVQRWAKEVQRWAARPVVLAWHPSSVQAVFRRSVMRLRSL